MTKLWGEIRKKLEKFDDWEERGLQELLREAQEVHVRRDGNRFQKLKETLAEPPVLSLSDVKKPFQLFITTLNQTAYGVLTQDWAGSKRPIGYFSKLLDPLSRGWPTYLQSLVAAALLIEEARKVTFGAITTVFSPHDVRGVLQQKAEKWLTGSRLLKYETILMRAPELELRVTGAQNPAQFLYGDPRGELSHNCIEAIEFQTKLRPDLE